MRTLRLVDKPLGINNLNDKSTVRKGGIKPDGGAPWGTPWGTPWGKGGWKLVPAPTYRAGFPQDALREGMLKYTTHYH
jgi:hypothetical protein